MAKRRDEMIRAAENREGGAKDLRCRAIKGIRIRLGDMIEKRDENGRVYKMVSTLICEADVAGFIEPITRTCEMEAGEHFGIYGELDQTLSPALREFLDAIKAEVAKKVKTPTKPVDPAEAKPLPSERPLDLDRSARMKALNAKMAAEKAAAKAAAEAEVAVGAEPQGGES